MDSFIGFSSYLRSLLNRDISKRALNSKFLSWLLECGRSNRKKEYPQLFRKIMMNYVTNIITNFDFLRI